MILVDVSVGEGGSGSCPVVLEFSLGYRYFEG